MLYGCYTAWARRARPEQFWKLDKMKQGYGERAGSAVHFIGYTVVPIGVGLVLVFLGLRGGSIF